MDTKERLFRQNPEEGSNFLSLLFFGWTAPILWKGARRDLQVTDLYQPLKSDESERLGDQLEREWKKELMKADENMKESTSQNKKGKHQPSLLRAVLRVFWFPYAVQGFLLFIQVMVLRIIQPMLQGWVISYFNPGQNLMTKNDVLLYASYLSIVTLVIIFLNHHITLRSQEIGMCIRVACCSLMYRKILRLDPSALNNTAGQVANLISNDVARFDFIAVCLHYVWIMPFQVMLVGCVMWRSIGAATIVGIGAIILQTLPLQGYLSRLSAKLRTKIAIKTDARVQLMSELITGIQVIKMYTWEAPFEKIVSKVRAMEMKFIVLTSLLKALYLSIMVYSERMTLFLTLISFVLMGNQLTPETTFVLATLFQVLQLTCAVFFPLGLSLLGETAVSLGRISDFLSLKEVSNLEKDESAITDETQSDVKPVDNHLVEHGVGVKLVNVAANWVHGQLPPTLCKISTEIESRSLSVLVGHVGSGKSSLLHLILGELSVGAGSMWLYTGKDSAENKISRQNVRISYASQDAWLFSASIRDNILFGQIYDKKRYEEVTRVCALLRDFEQLPQGDMSYVGERGASLSGGQRARVNLARAVYRDADIYLLDDPLSAVDPQVGRQLFEECILGFLKDKTRILATHQLQYLRQADAIIVLDHGNVDCQGTYEELAKSNPHTLDALQTENPEESKDEKVAEENLKENIEIEDEPSSMENSKEEPSTVSKKVEKNVDIKEEERATGGLSRNVYLRYFLAGGNLCSLGSATLIFIFAQILVNGTDYWVTYWTNQNSLRAAIKSNISGTTGTSYQLDTENNNQTKYPSVESLWFDEYGIIRTNVAIYVYTALMVFCMVFLLLRSVLWMNICMNASRNIHNSMFSNILRATMRFFNTNPSGRILNRFSKDVGAMDEILPHALIETYQVFAVMAGILVMVIAVNHWMIFPTLLLSGLFYLIRIYYLKTAQDIKRLEGITKSPVFSHISSTLDGLVTIRSTGTQMERLLQEEFDRHQDTHTGAWYLTIAAATTFGFTLDIISSLFVACVCFTFIFSDDGTIFGGSVGLAISQSLILTGTVQHGIRRSADVIAQMTSVERVLQYTNLPKEGPFTTEKPPPPTWPSKGALSFKNVYMRYAEHKAPILKDLNVIIEPGWKVGIVGRTGAGKTSLISALFRLSGEGLEGEIILDDIDTKSIGLHELRPHISIIPQEPILFSASLRYNLDPFEQYTDAELWDTLREVELAEAVPSLSFQVAGGGANFSIGQRQLICLARAILKNNRILLLDEATANVDRNTDALIQSTIRRRFADCTVLTIAHRLNTIMDSDRVLVMDEGQIVEFGHPHLLLKNIDGPFSQMVQETGKATASNLHEIAATAYSLNPEFRTGSTSTDTIVNNDNEAI